MKDFQLKFTGDLADTQGKPAGDLAWDLFADAPYVHYEFLADQLPAENDPSYRDRMYSMEITAEHVGSADAIVVCRPWVKAAAFANGSDRLVALGRAGIGYDKFDLDACTAADVVVFNSPYGLTHSTASSALFFILGLSKRFPLQAKLLRTGRWDLQKDAVGDDLKGQTLGIIGLGLSGLELARLIAPFGMRLIAYSPHCEPQKAIEYGVTLVVDRDQLLRESDYVSLHCRLTRDNHRTIGERELSLMKTTAYFVNVARGELVDEVVLAQFLSEGRLAGAGLDVYDTEPLPLTSPLLELGNVMLTPHWLPSTRQAGRATIVPIIEGMLSISKGGLPENILNPAVLDRAGFRAKLARYAG